MKKVMSIFATLAMAATLLSGALTANAATAVARPEHTIKKTATAPTIDGTISTAEWGDPLATVTPADATTAVVMEDGASQSAVPSSYTLYARWDDSKIYVGVQVVDAVHYNQHSIGENLWNGDAFEFDFGFDINDQSKRSRNTFALSNDGTSGGWNYSSETSGYVSGAINATVKVTRTGTTTTYEIAYPWTSFSATMGVGSKMFLNAQAHMANENTSYLGMMRYCGADAEGKVLFPLITLGDANGNVSASDTTTTTKPTTTTQATTTTVAAATTTTTVVAATTEDSIPSQAQNTSTAPQKENAGDVKTGQRLSVAAGTLLILSLTLLAVIGKKHD